MRVLDLDALSVVENDIQGMLEPYLESQKAIQSFLDSNQAVIDSLTSSLGMVAESALSVQKMMASTMLEDTFKQMQTIGEIVQSSLHIPDFASMMPNHFGNLVVDVFEERNVIIEKVTPFSMMTIEEKQEFSGMIVDEMERRGYTPIIAPTRAPLILTGASVEHLAFLPLREEKRVIVIVNGNYEKPISRRLSKYWDTLLRAAEGEEFSYHEYRGVFDYFNSHRDCPLYTRTGCSLTQVFSKTLGKLSFRVEIEIITERQFSGRANKLT